MNTYDRFLRFAAECEIMAKFTHSRENKVIWNRLAQRWLRCAELMAQHDTLGHRGTAARRQRTPVHSLAH
jgi:hypothetical protein